MRSGYCIQGGDNPLMHSKCTQPSRCTCSCHGHTPPQIEEAAVPEPAHTCDHCGEQFATPQGLGAHRRHNPSHRPDAPGEMPPPIKVPVAPDPEPDDQADDDQTLYQITGWYGGLHIDLTVSTGTDPIDADALHAVMGLTRVLEAE